MSMEVQTYNSGMKDQIVDAPPKSLASSVLANIFGQNGHAKTDEKFDRPSVQENVPQTEIARDVLRRFDSRKEKAAVELGIGVDEVESLPFDLSTLESEGIFMNIDCRGFGALVRQLEWKTLGLRLPENAAVRVSPPRAGLLPDVYRNQLMRGAAQAHQALTRYGFRFTLCETVWGTSEYKWIPWTAFEQFEQAYLKACETLAKAKSEVLEKYDEILEILEDSFRELANDSADRMWATEDDPFDKEEFINAIVAQAQSMIPTREMIRDGLVITMKPKVIVLGSEMIAEQNLRKTLSLETAKVDAERVSLELELDSKRRVEQIKVDQVEEETRQEREVRERIRNMKIEAARREAEEAVSPIKEGLSQLTAKIFEAASEMSGKLKGAAFVSGSLAKRARQMCEWYQLMNFTGDTSLEEVLDKLQNAAGREVKQRTTQEMQSALNDLIRLTSVQSKKLLDEDRLSALEL